MADAKDETLQSTGSTWVTASLLLVMLFSLCVVLFIALPFERRYTVSDIYRVESRDVVRDMLVERTGITLPADAIIKDRINFGKYLGYRFVVMEPVVIRTIRDAHKKGEKTSVRTNDLADGDRIINKGTKHYLVLENLSGTAWRLHQVDEAAYSAASLGDRITFHENIVDRKRAETKYVIFD